MIAPPLAPEHAEALDRANQLERENQTSSAAVAYRKAAALATRPRARDHADYRAARQLELAGDLARSKAAYLEIAQRNPEGEYASRCLYYAGRLTHDEGDLDGGLALLRRVIREYHFKGLAPQAVRRATQWLQEARSDDAAIEFLRVEEEANSGTDVGDTILYHWARIESDRGNWQKALERFERLDELYPWPRSTIWDEAMYQAAELADEHNEPQRAIGYLEKLTFWQEDSIATGSYVTNLTDDAQLLIGQIHLQKLNDTGAAIRAFEVLAGYPDSTLADDGLWWAAQAHVKAGSSGQACRVLRRLLREFPYSNKQRQARTLYREQACQRSSS